MGAGTRRHAQSDWIEAQLTASGWRAVDRGDVMRVPEVAARLGKAESYTRRLMREGAIPAHTVAWGSRSVWVAYARDVEQYMEAAGVTLADIGAEVVCPTTRSGRWPTTSVSSVSTAVAERPSPCRPRRHTGYGPLPRKRCGGRLTRCPSAKRPTARPSSRHR